jgi:hypothetical protein
MKKEGNDDTSGGDAGGDTDFGDEPAAVKVC